MNSSDAVASISSRVEQACVTGLSPCDLNGEQGSRKRRQREEYYSDRGRMKQMIAIQLLVLNNDPQQDDALDFWKREENGDQTTLPR
jgi:hypothetical protein